MILAALSTVICTAAKGLLSLVVAGKGAACRTDHGAGGTRAVHFLTPDRNGRVDPAGALATA